MFLDVGGEAELHQGPMQVLVRPFGLEIMISLQMVGEKAQTQLEGNETDSII